MKDAKLEELLKTAADAHYDCGNWDPRYTAEDFEETYDRAQAADNALRAYFYQLREEADSCRSTR